MKYDFILFENFCWATNHYKDICIIAEMLKNGGYSVAIADVFQESHYCKVDGVPHIPIRAKLNVSIEPAKSRYTIINTFINIIRKIFIDQYLKKAINEIIDKSDHFYVGSYHSAISLKWVREFPTCKNIVFWGLRSYRLYEYKVRPLSKVSFNSWRLRRYVDRNPQVCFFVSDELIRQEFKEIGISPSRIIVRPERYIKQLPLTKIHHSDKQFNILSIGSLRPSKRIELVLDALREINDKSIHYTIAGRIADTYKNEILQHINDEVNVMTLFEYLSEDTFNYLIEQTDFLVLADISQPSLVSNGTMNEALLSGIPLIAPNYPPYSYYINRYGIGITFNPSERGSLQRAIIRAKELGQQYFLQNIAKYQKKFLFENISRKFNNEITQKILVQGHN